MMDGRRRAGNQSLGGYLSGSSVTMAMRLAPSAATWWAICGTVEAAFGRLAAGHRDRVVVEDLVGDVDAGRGGRADRQQAGMGNRCRRRGSGRRAARSVNGAWPIQVAPSPPIWRDGRGAPARHRQRHAVAADAGHGAAALGHLGRGVVRAARAEIRACAAALIGARAASGCSNASSRASRCSSTGLVGGRAGAAARRSPRDHGRRRARPRSAAASRRVSSRLPTTRGRRDGVHVVEDAHQLVLDEAALFLDHQDVLQPVGEAPRAALLERPGQRRPCRGAGRAPAHRARRCRDRPAPGARRDRPCRWR